MKTFSLPARQRLGEILIRHGICGSAAVHDACVNARASNRRIGAVLIEAGHLSENELVEALAEQYDARPLFSLSGHILSPEVRNILPLETALLHKSLLFDLTENSMGIASYDPAANGFFNVIVTARKPFVTPYIMPYSLFMWAVIQTYQESGLTRADQFDTLNLMVKSAIPDSIRKVVMRYLVNSSRTITFENGCFSTNDGNICLHTLGIIDSAWMFGAIGISADGTVTVCGEPLAFRYDTRRLRRKVEDILRKSTCSRDVMLLASLLGADIE
jgi:hypothetical protein